MRAYVKRYDVQTKWIHFQLRMMNYWKIITLFGIKSVQILKKNMIANLCIIKMFENLDKIFQW